jgi:hypothetical protein
MAKAGNRVNVNVTTASSASPFTVSTALGSYETLVSQFNDGDVVEYAIIDGTNFEIGWGVVGGTGTTITRNVWESSSAGAAITLSGSATAVISLTKHGAAFFGHDVHRLYGGI